MNSQLLKHKEFKLGEDGWGANGEEAWRPEVSDL